MGVLASSPLEAGCTEACAGHSKDDFKSPGLPSYQHFRPSMRRQDQKPCVCDGVAALLHCCFASAVGIPIVESAVQAATAIAESCFVISVQRLRVALLLDSELLPNRGRSRTFPRIPSSLWAEGNPPIRGTKTSLITSRVGEPWRKPAPPLGLGADKWWSGSQRPTSAVSLQRLANVIVIRAAKRRNREDSQIDQRRCGVE